MNLNDSIQVLKGVGAKRKEILEKMNIRTVKDLIYTFPRKYEDRRTVSYIMNAPFNEDVLLEVIVVSKKLQGSPYNKKAPLKVLVEDSTGNLELVFFNAKYLAGYFFPGQQLNYPFLVDAASGSLRFFGLSLRMAVILSRSPCRIS